VQKPVRPDFSGAMKLLRRALPRGTRIERDPTDDAGGQVHVRVPGGPSVPLWLTASKPALESRADATPVLILRTRTPKQRDRLRRRGECFIDLAGAAYIAAPGFYLDRADLPAVRIDHSRRRGSDPYSDKASLVVRRLLLASTRRRWSTSWPRRPESMRPPPLVCCASCGDGSWFGTSDPVRDGNPPSGFRIPKLYWSTGRKPIAGRTTLTSG